MRNKTLFDMSIHSDSLNLNFNINNKRVRHTTVSYNTSHFSHKNFRKFCIPNRLILKLNHFERPNATHLQFFNGESASDTQLGVVTDRRTSDNRTKWTSRWTWEQSFRLFDTVLTSSLLPGRLVEPCSYMLLPIFMEVSIRDHIITFTHLE